MHTNIPSITKLRLVTVLGLALSSVVSAQGLDPTPQDQHLLELVNRMRTDPQAELDLLLNSNDSNVEASLDNFNVDLQLLAEQWAPLVPVPPLAWNQSINDAALGHSELMLEFDEQSHQLPGEPDFFTRVEDAGYTDPMVVGESIYAFAKSIFHAHAAWAIDWGNTPTGIQDPPGHRNNIMSTEFRELGVGIIDATDVPDKAVGPLVMTKDFGGRFNFGNPFLLGVVFQDDDENGFYGEGEGLGGVNVAIDGPAGQFNTTTLTAGGYQIQIPAGTYDVTFSGGSLSTGVVDSVTIGTDNFKLDLGVGAPPPPSADLAVSKTDTPDPVGFGSNLTYTITVTNKGPNAASGVTLTDTLPATVDFVSASTGCGNDGGVVTCTLGSLASGARTSVVIVVTTTIQGVITNTATVTRDQTDPVSGNDTAKAITTVNPPPAGPSADLAVSKTDTPDPVGLGSNVTYTITVTNKGPNATTGVTLTDTLPTTTDFVSASTGCGNDGGVVTCNLGSLASGARTSVVIVVTTTIQGVITNTATVTGAETDPVSSNNTAKAVTTVDPTPSASADLAVSKTATPNPVGFGSNVTYTITITNRGPNATTGVTFNDRLPATVDFVSASSGCVSVGDLVGCNVGSLASGGSTSVVIVVTATLDGLLTNTVTVTGDETDPDLSNNTASVVTTVNPLPPDLTVDINSPSITCTNTRKGNLCMNTGTLLLANNGVEFGSAVFDLSITEKAKPGKPSKWKIKGVIEIISLDLVDIPSTSVSMYLSDNDTLDPNDVPLTKKGIGTDALEKSLEKEKPAKLKGKVPKGADLSEKFILFVIDPENEVSESDETNNFVAFGPLS